MPQAVLPLLVGEGSGQVLEQVEAAFSAPAVEVQKPEKRVEVTRCEVIPDKVIITGRVIKNIPFKTVRSTGTADSRRPPVRIVCGDIRHCTLLIPFKLFIPIDGAREGDRCEVVEACVPGEVDDLIDENNDGLFERIDETIDIHVRVRVVRDAVVNVTGARIPSTPMIPFRRG